MLFAALVLGACGTTPVAHTPAVRATSTPPATSGASPEATVVPSPARGAQDAIPGPAGMTLSQEIGAVMMVGFAGPLTPAVVADWRQHQYGGLVIRPQNRNATNPSGFRQLIQEIRAAAVHTLLAATSQAGADAPALRALGFDVNLAPVADVGVATAVAGIHEAGMYAVVAASPGDTRPLKAAIGAQVEFVLVRHASDRDGPAMQSLRQDLGFRGVAISDDLLADTNPSLNPPPVAAVHFLAAGGDMVMVSRDLRIADVTNSAIHAAVLDGTYPRAQLDASVQKLLNLSLKFMP